MPRFLEVMFPEASVEVVEIDPEVTEVATEYLALPVNTRIVTYGEDARTKLQELPNGKYEFIVGDAFNDVSVPYHLTTLEFNEMVFELLSEDGVYAINIVDKMHSGRFLRSVVATLQETFPHVYVMRDNTQMGQRQPIYVRRRGVTPANPVVRHRIGQPRAGQGQRSDPLDAGD